MSSETVQRNDIEPVAAVAVQGEYDCEYSCDNSADWLVEVDSGGSMFCCQSCSKKNRIYAKENELHENRVSESVTDRLDNEPESPAGKQYEYGESEWELECEVDSEEFLAKMDAVAALMGDCRLHVHEDTLEVRAVDPANVAMVEVEIDRTDVRGGETVVGVPTEITRLADDVNYEERFILKLHVGGDEDTLTVQATDALGMVGDPVEVSVLDPAMVRDDPDAPDVEYETSFTVDGYQFGGALYGVSGTANHEVCLFTEGHMVGVAGNEKTGPGDVEWPYQVTFVADPGEDTFCLYMAEYVEDAARVLPLDEDVDVSFGHEQPIRIEADGLTFHLAPRIISETDHIEEEVLDNGE